MSGRSEDMEHISAQVPSDDLLGDLTMDLYARSCLISSS